MAEIILTSFQASDLQQNGNGSAWVEYNEEGLRSKKGASSALNSIENNIKPVLSTYKK